MFVFFIDLKTEISSHFVCIKFFENYFFKIIIGIILICLFYIILIILYSYNINWEPQLITRK